MTHKSFFENVLRDNKKFLTTQRIFILETVEQLNSHPTAEEVYIAVKRRMPKISLGTIYRNLQVLEELGFVEKLNIKLQTEARYEIKKEPHYHIICTRCLAIEDLGNFRSVSLEPNAQKMSGFETSGHDVTIYGLCPKCQNQFS